MSDLSIGAPTEPTVKAKNAPKDNKSEETIVALVPEAPAEVEETVVRGLIKSVGLGANQFASDEDVPEQWKWKDAELDALVPPLTRYINRNAKLRAAVIHGDQATIAVILAGYTGRNIEDGRKASKKRKERDELTGETAGVSGGVRPGGTNNAAVPSRRPSGPTAGTTPQH